MSRTFVAGKARFTANLDLYNAFNANPVTTQVNTFGTSLIAGILYVVGECDHSTPSGEYFSSSVVSHPMPWIKAPSTCPKSMALTFVPIAAALPPHLVQLGIPLQEILEYMAAVGPPSTT
jgi:hypothetical protein